MAAPSKKSVTAATGSGAASAISSNSARYEAPDDASTASASSALPPGKKWYTDPIGAPDATVTCLSEVPW